MSDDLTQALAAVREDVANGRLNPALGVALDELARLVTEPDPYVEPETSEEN